MKDGALQLVHAFNNRKPNQMIAEMSVPWFERIFSPMRVSADGFLMMDRMVHDLERGNVFLA